MKMNVRRLQVTIRGILELTESVLKGFDMIHYHATPPAPLTHGSGVTDPKTHMNTHDEKLQWCCQLDMSSVLAFLPRPELDSVD